MTYYAAKMSFIKKYLQPIDQMSESPIILAERAIMAAPEHVKAPRFQPMRRVKGYIDFYIGDTLTKVDILTKEERLIAFKISKMRFLARDTLSKKKFGKVELEHFPPSVVLWSATSQTIFIEKPKKDQMSVQSIINNLQAYLSSRLVQYGFIVLIAPLPHESSFWKEMDRYDIKYSVEFTLFAPNFLDAASSTRDLVESNKKNYNANTSVIKLVNEDGNLQIRKGDNFIENLLAWIKAGAGKWRALVGVGDERKSINSAKGQKTLDETLSKYDAEIAEQFTSKAVDSINEE